MLYGETFTRQNAPQLIPKFATWVDNIANGQLVGFFDDLGEMLRKAVAERKVDPQAYAAERSVLDVYLETGAVERHDEESLTGLLSMTLMAAVFNTQVSHGACMHACMSALDDADGCGLQHAGQPWCMYACMHVCSR